MAQANNQKDVIYIDVDDEITAVIEKVQASSSKIVALVLPKRATVFQSTVNMRLLKRSADSAKKNLVLITSESGLLPLAGVVGLHVAKTLQSKPAIPAAPTNSDAPVALDDTEVIDDTDAATALAPVPEDDEPIEVDNDDLPDASTPTSKKPYNKKLRVPNFDKFRVRLFLIVMAVVVAVGGWLLAAIVLPKATITIKTDTTDVQLSVAVISSPKYTSLNADADPSEVPGKLQELKKTDTQKTPATGKKDMGTKATGTVTLTTQISCSTAQPPVVPAGTTITSESYNFITEAASNYTFTGDITGSPPNVKCTWKTGAIKVTAQKPGDQYNLSARSYTVSGFSSVTAAGSAMSGGTSKIITVVSQQDIDGLKQKMIDSMGGTANSELSAQLKDAGYFPLTETFTTKDPLVTSSPAVDAEASEVTVNVTVTYTMAGAKQDDLSKLLDQQISKQIDTSKQKIIDNGLNSASVRIEEKQPDGTTRFSIDTTAKVGVEPNADDIKQAVAGKKKGEAKGIIQSRPGVKDVTIETSPFWVSKIPKNQDKITIVFEQ